MTVGLPFLNTALIIRLLGRKGKTLPGRPKIFPKDGTGLPQKAEIPKGVGGAAALPAIPEEKAPAGAAGHHPVPAEHTARGVVPLQKLPLVRLAENLPVGLLVRLGQARSCPRQGSTRQRRRFCCFRRRRSVWAARVSKPRAPPQRKRRHPAPEARRMASSKAGSRRGSSGRRRCPEKKQVCSYSIEVTSHVFVTYILT